MIVVTGGAGFIGSAFVWKLNQEGISDIVIVDVPGNSAKEENLKNRAFHELISREDFLQLVLDDAVPWECDALIHMGACTSTTEMNVDYLTENNYLYTRTLAEWAVGKGVRFIYASSAATYGDGSLGYSDEEEKAYDLHPLHPYGRSKHQFDLWAIETEAIKNIVGLKFFNVYGPNEYHKEEMRSVIHKAFFEVKKTDKIRLFKSYRSEYRDGEQKRDFIYVKDCVDVMWWLLHNQNVNGIFNLGTGTARTWNDLANAVFKAMDRKPVIEYFDMPESMRGQYQYFTEAAMSKLRATGYPTEFQTLESGVEDYLQNYLAQSHAYL